MLKAHPSLLYTEEIKAICKPLEALNITTFANGRIDRHGAFSSICTHPEFMLNYVAKEYHRADLHIRRNFTDIGQCLMWDMMDCFGKTAEMLEDAAQFQFRHIFTLIEDSHTHTDFYHFGTHLNRLSMNQMYVNNLDLLKKFIRYFRSVVDTSPRWQTAYSFALQTNKEDHFEIAVPEEALYFETNREAFMHALQQQNKQGQLSPRLEECTHYLLRGYSSKEMARAMHISHRTVEGYVALLKGRFKVRNKSELIALLLNK